MEFIVSMFKMDWFQVAENKVGSIKQTTINTDIDDRQLVNQKKLDCINASINELNRIRVEWGLKPITD